MCLYTRLIKNRKYQPNKKNGGQVPPLPLLKNGQPDKRVLAVPIGCGKCIECTKKKARDWQVRLTEDIKHYKHIQFVTLTFSDKSILALSKEIDQELYGYKRDNAIAILAVRRFLENWRSKHGKSVRHWFVTELGGHGTENIHLHGLIYTDKINDIKEKWKYGYIWISGENKGFVTDQTINYMVKYIHKVDMKHKHYKPRVLNSDAIGKGYIERDGHRNKYNGTKTEERYKNNQGYNFGLPIYYRNKIYSEEEREKLWLQKLDKQIMYVGKIKIDVSKGMEQYWKVRDYAREKNTQLGFGERTNWEAKKTEEIQRNINYLTRIQRAFAKEVEMGK